jgi:predicted acyl esterase
MASGKHRFVSRVSSVGLLVALGMPLTMACAGDDMLDGGTEGDTDGSTANFDVRGSLLQVHVWNAEPGSELELVDAEGEVVTSGTTDDLGSIIWREVEPGDDYVVRTPDLVEESAPFTVWTEANSLPEQSFYDEQELEAGFGYITTRDGTELSIYVQLPGPIEDGPYPTLVNYSGYDPSQPGAPLDFGGLDLSSLCDSVAVLCDAPTHPSGLIAGALGFATVGVNMRGTGCSGGAYDFFELLQLTDGYDVAEAVAAQDWVKGNQVGMIGLSYPGITQLFTASKRPPSLVAITPLSVISDVQSTLLPGGIMNNGFALSWAENVLNGAQPYGKGWEQGLVDMGDETCAENQLLHGQAIDILQKARDNPYYDPAVADPLNLNLLAEEIDIPIFLAGAWQDEQTGPGFASLISRFGSSPLTRTTIYNGVHADGFQPEVLAEWFNFLSIYVDEEIPIVPTELRNLAPLLFEQQFGDDAPLPDGRFEDYTDFDQVKTEFEADPPIRAFFSNGAFPSREAGFPWPAWETSFQQWPPEGTTASRWYFQPDGTMAATEPTASDSASKFAHDVDEGQTTVLPNGGEWDLQPNYEWNQHDPGFAVVFESPALTEDQVMLGYASADLWILSTTDDADLEVTISEVTPDDKETYVQSGWLRASLRALAPDATELRPTHSWLEDEAAPLPADWEPVRVEIFSFGHVFRAGSRVRVSIDTPGASRQRWRFETLPELGGHEVSIAHSAEYPSSVVLPLIGGLQPGTPDAAPCGSLRGQPCRDYLPYTNTPG